MKKLLCGLLLVFPLNTTAPEIAIIDRQAICPIEEAVYLINKIKFLECLDTMSFSPDNLYKALLYQNIKHPEIVFQQAYIETGGFKSNYFRKYHNLFGMKFARRRLTTSYGKINKHGTAGYYSWQASVLDYKYFQDYYFYKGRDMTDYKKFLKELPYAQAKYYIEALNTININKYIP